MKEVIAFVVVLVGFLGFAAVAGAFITLNPLWLFEASNQTRGFFGVFACCVACFVVWQP